ncbi:60S ribosomal protein L27a-like [Herpailurus yagouaroundi]|uniref:60S ribosomal protein L27a-like n=1 Tax=Herpailurus yagouaroundi TaxID=1608482 RepID=UPI001AD7AD3F|nr:60S ribosomal protein L27a-like [Puma yagouaroundi]
MRWHHHRINFHKYHPSDFGKAAMRDYHLKRNQSLSPTFNLDELRTLISEGTLVNATKNKTRAVPVIDVMRLGYYNVLGKGKFPEQPVIMKKIQGQASGGAEGRGGARGGGRARGLGRGPCVLVA